MATAREQFEAEVGQPEAAIDLARAALLIAKEEYPDLEPARYLRVLDDLAAGLAEWLERSATPRRQLERLGQFLAVEQGFRGNAAEYYDPRNSFLNEVIDRRLGLPITLSIVYLEVGRRAGLPLVGVGMPGHFIVKVAGAEPAIFADPFNRGEILTLADCRGRIEQSYGGLVEFRSDLVAGVSKRQLLARVLRNLKGIYVSRRDYPRALAAVDRVLLLEPEIPEEWRDRGLIRQELGDGKGALADLERYLKLAPSALDGVAVRERVGLLKRTLARLN
ncbi:MAG: tetratricopeptide repeat protein [Chloroflexi bacterium]|nr:tetratricopeptide repeat protein [Chloroflexota bacterium]